MRTEDRTFNTRIIPFLRIISLGIVFAVLNVASSVVVTLLLAILLAYFLDQVNVMLRGYLIGNALVALILMFASWAFFLSIHLDYPFLAGCVSGLLNLVPYLGAVLAWLPPFFVGMVKWKSVGPYAGVGAAMLLLHIVGLNVLMPAIVGRRVHLNPLAVTISLLFWGWLWGAIGLILAIPITATVKVICDHVEGWEAVGSWLGA